MSSWCTPRRAASSPSCLSAVTAERAAQVQARILLFHGQSGAGKTHLIRALRTSAHRTGRAYFGYAQMTPDVANYADYYLRRLVASLEKPYDPDKGGESALARLTNGLVGDAAVVDPASLDKLRDAKLSEASLAKLVLGVADQIVAAPEVRRPEPRHQYRARAALSAALRPAHRPARAPVSLRAQAERPVAGGGGGARSQHGRGARLRDHRVARPPDVVGGSRGAGVRDRSGRGPALLRRLCGALPEGGARPDPDRQSRADLHRARLLPRRFLRQGARGAGAVLHRPHREGRPGAADRDAHGRGGAAHHRQAPAAGPAQRRLRSHALLRSAVLRGVRRPLDPAHPGAGADAHARAGGRRAAGAARRSRASSRRWLRPWGSPAAAATSDAASVRDRRSSSATTGTASWRSRKRRSPATTRA